MMKYFWEGFFSIFNIAGYNWNNKFPIKKRYKKTITETQLSDNDAIKADWENVGNYLNQAMNNKKENL